MLINKWFYIGLGIGPKAKARMSNNYAIVKSFNYLQC